MNKNHILSCLSAESIATVPQSHVSKEEAMLIWDGDSVFYTFVAFSHPDNIMKVGVIQSSVEPTSEW